MHIANSTSNAATLFKMMGQNQMSHSQNKAMQNDLAQISKSFHPAQTLPEGGAGQTTTGLPSDVKGNQNIKDNLGQNPSSNTNTNQSTSQSSATTARANVTPAQFNGMGNLSNGTNLKDFALINNQQVMLQQSLRMSQAMATSQQAMVQPSISLQIALTLRLYERLEQSYKNRQQLDLAIKQGTLHGAQADADLQAASAQSQVLAMVFMEKVFKLFDTKFALGRLFKKGPDGENLHEENTDDEYGTQYADVDAQTDYIKRPRHYSKEMQYHYSMLTPR